MHARCQYEWGVKHSLDFHDIHFVIRLGFGVGLCPDEVLQVLLLCIVSLLSLDQRH